MMRAARSMHPLVVESVQSEGTQNTEDKYIYKPSNVLDSNLEKMFSNECSDARGVLDECLCGDLSVGV
jgi:hypothetical protein